MDAGARGIARGSERAGGPNALRPPQLELVDPVRRGLLDLGARRPQLHGGPRVGDRAAAREVAVDARLARPRGPTSSTVAIIARRMSSAASRP